MIAPSFLQRNLQYNKTQFLHKIFFFTAIKYIEYARRLYVFYQAGRGTKVYR